MTRRRRTSKRAGAPGFTLIETGLALVIISVGLLAIMQAQQAFLVKNAWSSNAATSGYLADELRELTRPMPRHDRFSGGLYYATPGDTGTLTGWGPEAGETDASDLDDLDDFDGAVFGNATNFPAGFTMTRRYPGPINALGDAIANTLWDGTSEMVEVDGEMQPVTMRGWTQIITVEKVDPFNYATPVADNAQITAGSALVRAVDRYPVRVTVTVLFQGEFDTQAQPVSGASWIVPP
ncbi:MAG: hypothetical protein RLN60_01060 [Phycisphaerales bacterium]